MRFFAILCCVFLGAFHVRDASAEALEPVVIGVIGDYGLGSYGPSSAEAAVANLVKSWSPDFIMTLGDNNYGQPSAIDTNIGQFYHDYIYPYAGKFGSGAVSNRFFPALGNHDWSPAGQTAYSNYFTLPGNERYYRYRCGPVEIFAINSNADVDGNTNGSVQANWLRTQLADSDATWKLVYFHHPPYCSGWYRPGTLEMRWPFAEWGATAVLAGHDHIYERLHLSNMVYFVNGLGGVERYDLYEPVEGSALRFNQDFGAMRIRATDTNLVFHFVTRSNAIIDSFTIGPPTGPLILSEPTDRTLFLGGNTNFYLVVTVADRPLTYQWQFNGTDIPGATNASLAIDNAQLSDEGEYSVVVSDGINVMRPQSARLSILRQPVITAQPTNQNIWPGSNAVFRVAAQGGGQLSYQWLLNGQEIAGATSSNLTVASVRLDQNGEEYTVRISDALGSTLSEPAWLTVLVRPVVVQPPVSQSVVPGEPVTLSVSASGALPLNFVWRFNTTVPTNVTLSNHTSFLTIPNAQTNNAGNYQVLVLNSAGASGWSSAVVTLAEDVDGDGLADSWEHANDLDPGNPADGALDLDGDGLTNKHEYSAGTDPRDDRSYVALSAGIATNATHDSVELQFTACSNKTYAVEYRTDLSLTNWTRLASIAASATNRTARVTDQHQSGGNSRFYRVVTPVR